MIGISIVSWVKVLVLWRWSSSSIICSLLVAKRTNIISVNNAVCLN